MRTANSGEQKFIEVKHSLSSFLLQRTVYSIKLCTHSTAHFRLKFASNRLNKFVVIQLLSLQQTSIVHNIICCRVPWKLFGD